MSLPVVSLATTAVIPEVESAMIEVGGGDKNVTTIAGAFASGTPQAASAANTAMASEVNRRFDWRTVIVWVHSQRRKKILTWEMCAAPRSLLNNARRLPPPSLD
jgi:F420-0:gamma-glutamyl ligase-like protein